MTKAISKDNPAIALIWAMTRNGVIGRDQGLPWRLPEDLRFFMVTTTAKPVIMGRKTFESMKAPLPRRTNIVVTRTDGYDRQGITVASSLEAALETARSICQRDGRDEIMVAGGSEIYRQALPLADRLYLTLIDTELEGDTQFPDIDWADFSEVWRRDCGPLPAHDYPFSLRMYERVAAVAEDPADPANDERS